LLPKIVSPDTNPNAQGALPMKSNRKNFPSPKDTPATRKRRLQQRLKEISEKSEQELAAIKKSVDKVKAAFKPKKT
jgi:hypothetical protein